MRACTIEISRLTSTCIFTEAPISHNKMKPLELATTVALLAGGAAALRDLRARHEAVVKSAKIRAAAAAGKPAAVGGPLRGTPGTANCTELWFNQTVDHFSWNAPPTGQYTYQQRYFVYDKYWDRQNGAIFFYNGNEADVTLYVDHTGLMWENAQSMGALLVFAEHRFYGAWMGRQLMRDTWTQTLFVFGCWLCVRC